MLTPARFGPGFAPRFLRLPMVASSSKKTCLEELAGAVFLLLFLIWLPLRIGINPAFSGDAVFSPDSHGYLRPLLLDGGWQALFQDWFLGARPAGSRLLATLTAGDAGTMILIQGAVSTLCWGGLAWVVRFRSGTCLAGAFGGCLVLLLSLHRMILGWDNQILSESLTFSLAAAFTGLFLLLFGPDAGKVEQGESADRLCFGLLSGGLVVTGILWAGMRDSVFPLILLSGLLVWFAPGGVFARMRRKRPWQSGAVVAVLLFAVGSGAGLLLVQGDRWLTPFLNAITMDILPDPDARAWLAEKDMPLPKNVDSIAGRSAYDLREAGQYLSALADWGQNGGRSWLYRYYLENPQAGLRPLAARPDGLLATDVWQYVEADLNAGQSLWTPLRSAISGLAALVLPGGAFLVIWLVLLAGLVATGRLPFLPFAWLLLLAAGAVGLAFLGWHSDGLEKERHVLTSALILRLVWVLSLVNLVVVAEKKRDLI